MTRTLIQQQVIELVEKHGSFRALARTVHVDVGYLHRLATGEKIQPGDSILRRLGLRRITHYEKINP